MAENKPSPMMTPAEARLLAAHLRPEDHVFEWGAGGSTLWLADLVCHVTTVEHQRAYARSIVESAPANVTLIYAQPDREFAEGGDDGDFRTFRRYVDAYWLSMACAYDVVIIDGRARVECAAAVIRRPPWPRAVFVHDVDRAAYAPIWEVHMRQVERVENLMRLEP